MRPIHVAFFANKRDNQPRSRVLSWDQVRDSLQRHIRREEKDGRLWSPVEYPPDATRGNENVISLHALVLDFDKGAAWPPFSERWQEWEHVIYSTHSSTAELPKWRAVFPLAVAVPAGDWPRTYRKLVLALAGGQVDPSCKDASRMYYTPSAPTAATPFAQSVSGAWLDPARFPDPAPAPRMVTGPLPNAQERPPSALLLDRALSEIGEGRHHRSLWLACQLRDNGYSESEAAAVLGEFVVRCPDLGDPFTAEEAEHNVRTAYARGARSPWEPLDRPGRKQPLLPPVERLAAEEEDPTADTSLPHSDLAETGLVAGILGGAAEQVLREVFDLVSPPDCYYRAHDVILGAARDLLESRDPVSRETVALQLEQNGRLEQIGGAATLLRFKDRAPHQRTLRTLAETIARKSRLRGRIEMLREAEQACFSRDADPEQIDDQLTRDLLLVGQGAPAEAVCYADVIDREMDRLRRGVSERVLGFGLQCVDRIVEGLEPGDVGIVCGRPGSGKSVYCAMQLHHGAQEWGPGLYLSLEMKAVQLIRRDLAGFTNIRYQELRAASVAGRETFSTADLEAISQAATALKETGRNIWIEEKACKLSQLTSRIHRYRLQHGIKFLVVDYGQLVRDDTRRGVGKAEEVMNVARALKNEVAMAAEMPVWVAVQANRESEKGNDKSRMLQFRDLGWSSEWEAVASTIVFLNPSSNQAGEDTLERRHIILDCQKNRNGGRGQANLILDGPKFRFCEETSGYDDRDYSTSDERQPYAE